MASPICFLLFTCIISTTNSAKVYRFPRKTNLVNQWLPKILKVTANEGTIIWTQNLNNVKPDLIDEIVKSHLNSTVTGQLDIKTFLQLPYSGRKKFASLRQSTKSVHLIIIKQMKFWWQGCVTTLRLISQLNDFYSSMPTVLIVLYGSKQYRPLKLSELHFLKSAWLQFQFLDLTVIYAPFKQKSSLIFGYYDPFREKFHEQCLKRDSILFPEKLKDMKGHPLYIGIESNQSQNIINYEESRRDRKDFLIELSPGNYIFVKYIFCRVCNCNVVMESHNSLHKIDMFGGAYIFYYGDNKVDGIGLVYQWLQFGAAIPQLDLRTENSFVLSNVESYKMYMFLLFLILFLKTLTGLLKLDARSWPMMKVISFIIFGSSLNVEGSLKEKVWHLLLTVLSLYISQDLLNYATTGELNTARISVNDWQDLYDLNLPIYSEHSAMYDFADNNVTKKLRKQTIYGNVTDCLWKLVEKNDRICMTELFALNQISSEIKTKRNKGDERMAGLRKANFKVLVSVQAQKHDMHSPYLELFDRIVLRSLDHGLILRPTTKEYVNAFNYDYDEHDYDVIHIKTFDLSIRLLFVVLLIYTFAMIVFFIEIQINTLLKIADANWFACQRVKNWFVSAGSKIKRLRMRQ